MRGSLKKQGRYWTAIVYVTDAKGEKKQKWINTKCEKKPDAEKVLQDILKDINSNSFIEPSKLTFVDLMEDWVTKVVRNKVEQTTWEAYAMIWNVHIKPYFKESYDMKLSELKPIHLQKYFEYKYKEGRSDGKGGLSACTLRKHYACIAGALEYASRMELIAVNPIRKVTLPKNKKFEGKFYNAEQINKLLTIIMGTSIESAVYLALSLGLRRGEVLGLKWKNIDLEEGTISIKETRTKYGTETIVKEPKNKSSKRTLPISWNLEDYLKVLKRRMKKNKDLYGNKYHDGGYVCCWDDGTPIKGEHLNHKFKKLLSDNDMEHIRFHDLRHTTATFLLKQGASMKEISTWLGHCDIGITMNTYGHVDAEMKKNTSNLLNDIQGKVVTLDTDNKKE